MQKSLRKFVWATVLVIGVTFSNAAVAGTCPPCNSLEVGTDACVLSCCYFQSCDSPAGPGCVAVCNFGLVLSKIFGDEDNGNTLVPAFVIADSGVAKDRCEYANRLVGILNFSGKDSVLLEVSGYDLKTDAFVGIGDEYDRVEFHIMPISLNGDGAELTHWNELGPAEYDSARASWKLYLRPEVLDPYSDYLIRASFSRDGYGLVNAFAYGALSSAQTTK